jgi:hypothetical protein
MKWIRLSLLIGGLFNVSMGFIFLSNRLLNSFFSWAETLERTLFQSMVILNAPSDPLVQLLIHGFGAGVMILGVTLLYSTKDPRRFLPFILFDGLGRLFFGLLMLYYVVIFSMIRIIYMFGLVELSFAVTYICASWILYKKEKVPEFNPTRQG